MIEQAFVRPAGLDPPVSRKREIAEAWIGTIDRDRLGKFAGEIGGSDVQRPTGHSKHHALPSQRRQSPAKRLQLNNQRWLGLSPGPAGAPISSAPRLADISRMKSRRVSIHRPSSVDNLPMQDVMQAGED